MQEAAASLDQNPAAHGRHVEEPNGAKVPALQFAHVLPKGTVPGKHGEQKVDPVAIVKVPVVQGEHTGAPGEDE